MKGILISIKPQHVVDILNGHKTIEIRKTMPKCELPCKVYIYCTYGDMKTNYMLGKRGFVVGEFTLNKIDKLEYRHLSVSHTNAYIPVSTNADYQWEKHCCVDYNSIVDYGKFAPLYAWHIDDLKIYDEPKELSAFRKDLDCDDYPCSKGGKNSDCEYCYYDYSEGCQACGIDFDGEHCIYKAIKRPPQSWCYVEVNNESI